MPLNDNIKKECVCFATITERTLRFKSVLFDSALSRDGYISNFKGDIWSWTGTGNSAGHEEAIMPAAAVVDPLSNPIWWDRLHRWDE